MEYFSDCYSIVDSFCLNLYCVLQCKWPSCPFAFILNKYSDILSPVAERLYATVSLKTCIMRRWKCYIWVGWLWCPVSGSRQLFLLLLIFSHKRRVTWSTIGSQITPIQLIDGNSDNPFNVHLSSMTWVNRYQRKKTYTHWQPLFVAVIQNQLTFSNFCDP